MTTFQPLVRIAAPLDGAPGGSLALRPTQRVLPSASRRHNRSLVLSILFHDGPASRSDLARTTGLTRMTISDVIGDLIDEDLVEELGQRADARIGKPAILVGIRSTEFHIVAIDLTEVDIIRGAVMDLAGTIVDQISTRPELLTGDAALTRLRAVCRELLSLSGKPLLGIGIGSPGIVDAAGTIVSAPNLAWANVPLARILGDELGVPVHVANDANAAALGEFAYGGAAEGGLMVLTIGEGIGAGIIVDGTLLRGHRLAAGEIGHVTVDPLGAACACGRRGCLEAEVSVSRLRARLAGLDPESSDAVLASVGHRLGGVLAPIVSALNLQEVLVSAPADLFDGVLLAETLHTIRERTLPEVTGGFDMRMAVLGEEAALKGAAVLVLIGELGFS
jgi:predicted NBD/HSP70 family sugar kinase